MATNQKRSGVCGLSLFVANGEATLFWAKDAGMAWQPGHKHAAVVTRHATRHRHRRSVSAR